MSIGVIRKWGPEDIDRNKHPTLREFAEKFRQPEVRLRDLNRTSGSMEEGHPYKRGVNDAFRWNKSPLPKCDKCKGEGCFDCEPDKWGALRPDTGGETEPLGVTQLGQGGDISIGEPMDLTFRFLKGQGQSIRGDQKDLNNAISRLAEHSGILDDAGADPEDQVREEQPEEREDDETPEERLARLIQEDPELRERKRRQPTHALAGQKLKRFQPGLNHPDHALHRRGNLGLGD